MRGRVIKWFKKNHYEIYRKMRDTDHGYEGKLPNPYHLEGSIWTHTEMVLNEVDKLFDPTVEMYLIAVLHDVGKPFVYFDDHKRKRRRFFGHEEYSAKLAEELLDDYERVYNEKIDKRVILKTISNHGRFYNYMTEGGLTNKGEEKIFEYYKDDLKGFDYLREFYVCDYNGRITENLRIDNKVLRDLNYLRDRIVNYSEMNDEEGCKLLSEILS